MGFRSCLGIIRLGKDFSADRLEAACSRALAAKAYSYKSVKSILTSGLDKAPVKKTPAQPKLQHANIRGADYYRN